MSRLGDRGFFKPKIERMHQNSFWSRRTNSDMDNSSPEWKHHDEDPETDCAA